jgi:hypothetical protein
VESMNNEQLRHKYSLTLAYLFMSIQGDIIKHFREVKYEHKFSI